MDTDKKIIMTKKIAREWLEGKLVNEYRLKIYTPFPLKLKYLPTVFKLFRNNKFKMAGVRCIPDLGVFNAFDYVLIWSSDKEELEKVQEWLEAQGCETSGVT